MTDLSQREPHVDEPAAGPPRPSQRSTLIRRVALVNSALVAIAVLAFVSTRPLGIGPASQTPDPGASFFVLGKGSGGLDIGRPAPELAGRANGQTLRLSDLDGRPITLADLRGRPVWVVFWATWCPPCQRETPDLRATFEAHKQDGLAVVAVDVQESADVVGEYVRKFGLGYTVGLDSTGAISETYGVFGLPTHYFIDRQGIIRDRNFGPLTREQMEQRVATIEIR